MKMKTMIVYATFIKVGYNLASVALLDYPLIVDLTHTQRERERERESTSVARGGGAVGARSLSEREIERFDLIRKNLL